MLTNNGSCGAPRTASQAPSAAYVGSGSVSGDALRLACAEDLDDALVEVDVRDVE